MMNPHLPAVPPAMPAIPRRPGRHPNDHFHQPPLPQPGPGNYHYPHPQHPHPHQSHTQHPHAQPYPPQQYRAWGAPPLYPAYPMPPPQPQYPNAPLVVSSYPHSQPPLPHQIQQPPPPPPQQQPSQQPPPQLPRQPPPRPSSSSTHSQVLISPTTSNTSLNVATPPLTTSTASIRVPTPPLAQPQFRPPLPWYSVPEEPFPARAPRRRRKRQAPQPSDSSVELPALPHDPVYLPAEVGPAEHSSSGAGPHESAITPSTSQAASETDSTDPTTPASSLPPTSITPKASQKSGPRAILPAIPLNHTSHKSHGSVASTVRDLALSPTQASKTNGHVENSSAPSAETVISSEVKPTSPTTDEIPKAISPPPKATPKSWADLVRSSAPKPTSGGGAAPSNGSSHTNGHAQARASSLVEVLNSFKVDKVDGDDRKIHFLEPRGLVNTGNMCYMNAVLQVLVFCVPFYDFLDGVGKQAAHSFKSNTPLLDAMIMFMREFPVIDSAVSVEQLRLRLKDAELEQYGEAFIPEFVYEVIRRLPRFASMRRGHQQDAEEFLGFLLEELHDECAQVLREASMHTSPFARPTATEGRPSSSHDSSSEVGGGWLEVGPKQKSSVTRSSGMIATESPVTKIFGGKLRSELRVPGLKNSVTLEPYQPLQLDIQSPLVHNITDALKGLTRSETLHGDFRSPRGPGATATKQVFIETLPPVLILHLKRFQYDNAGGTQKIWKKVGYPLQLEIPKEAFPPHRRGGLAVHGGLPKYRLISVIYHHGKNATGGHYTVDVRRQDGREWARLDDTVIRRLRSQDVAEGGHEEDPKVLAAALEQHQRDANGTGNLYGRARDGEDEEGKNEKGWKQVNGATAGEGESSQSKSSPGRVNGHSSPIGGGKATSAAAEVKSSLKDNKVAYLLFYQRL